MDATKMKKKMKEKNININMHHKIVASMMHKTTPSN